MTKSSVQLRQFTLILGLAVGVSACSTIADLDPTGLIGDSSDNAPASQFPDQAAPTASDQSVGTTPDLASLPARPAPAAAPADQQQTAQSLASDGAQARYSGDALRGGTEAAAPPPAASEAAPNAAQQLLGTAAADAPPTASDAPPTAALPAAAPAAPPPQVAAAAPPPAAEAPALRRTEAAAPAPAAPGGAEPAVPANAPVQTAALPAAQATPVGPSAGSAAPARSSGGEPAVPANAPMRGGVTMAAPAMSDAALGFKPSAAPPLDPSVGQFVSAPIVAHYRQTASLAGAPSASMAAVPAVPPKGARAGSDNGVVANLDSVSSGAGRMAMMNGGMAPTAVVYFAGDGVKLSKAAHAQVRAAVSAFKADGGQGTIRVVGHASSRTPNMPVEKHLETIFSKSQARANAVAQELIHQGVPAARVLIDAVGDSQPVYYESMPKGEAGNRRAEIFVQG